MPINIVEKTFKDMYGQICWKPHHSRLLNLSMNFGPALLRVDLEPTKGVSASQIRRRLAANKWPIRPSKSYRIVDTHGKWWLWIYLAYWKISAKGVKIATSSSPAYRIGGAMRDLIGQRLTNVEIDPGTGATCFTFDLDSTLEVRRKEKNSDDELWLLYKPSGYVLSVRGDGTYTHAPGSGLDKRKGVVRKPLWDARQANQ